MQTQYLRIGKISSFNFPKGTARVTYEDKDGSTTAEFPFLSWQYMMPEVGDQVLVAHLSNGTGMAPGGGLQGLVSQGVQLQKARRSL